MDLFKIREEFTRSGIMICFNGPFSHSIIEEIGVAVRNHLAAENLGKASVLDVFAIYVELAQNVKNYFTLRALPIEVTQSSIIIIAKQNGRYVITSGNNVLREDAPPLATAIDQINALDSAGLRKRYKEQMRKETPSNALGAGLGLLEIARRATEKMVYTVSEVDEKMAFFCITAYV